MTSPGVQTLFILITFLSTARESNITTTDVINDQLLRIIPSATEDVPILHKTFEIFQMDVWHEARNSSAYFDVRASPDQARSLHQVLHLLDIEAKVIVSDLQQRSESIRQPTKGFDWSDYHSLDDMYSWMRSKAAQHASIASLLVIGQSIEGRPLLGLRIAHKRNLPIAVIEAGVHAREWIGPPTALWFANEALDSQLQIVRSFEWHIFPTLNPDGYVYSYTTGLLVIGSVAIFCFYSIFKRKYLLNGYRYSVASSNDFEALTNIYKFIAVHNIVSPAVCQMFAFTDSEIAKSGNTANPDRWWRKNRNQRYSCVGVDINRNFPFKWERGEYCGEMSPGYGPSSEPETRALAHHMSSLAAGGRAKVYISLHSYGNYLMYPWAYTRQLPFHERHLSEVAQQAVTALSKRYGTSYSIGRVATTIYRVGGSSLDYAFSLNIPYTFVFELRGGAMSASSPGGFVLPRAQIIPTAQETYDAVLVILQRASSS